MNLDFDGSYDDDVLKYLQDRDQEMHKRHYKVVLPEDRAIFKCRNCAFTIGSAGEHLGSLRFKINLNRTYHKSGWFDDCGWVDIENQTGGKCPGTKCGLKCATVHRFSLEEIARELGFEDCEDALTSFLIKGRRVSDADTTMNAVWFVKSYIYRTDDKYKEFVRRPYGENQLYTANSIYSDSADVRERRRARPAPTPIEDGVDESDPFADDD